MHQSRQAQDQQLKKPRPLLAAPAVVGSYTDTATAAGNTREPSWSTSGLEASPFVTRERVRGDLWGCCETCYYADTCRAGCTWMSDMLLGKPGNNPYCHHRAIELTSARKREPSFKSREAPGVVRPRTF